MNTLTKIKIEDNQIADRLIILRTKRDSMKNLFTSFMNDKFELFNEFKLAEFINDYTLTSLEYNELIHCELIKHFTLEEIQIITAPCNRFCISFSYLTKEISVMDKHYCKGMKEGSDELSILDATSKQLPT